MAGMNDIVIRFDDEGLRELQNIRTMLDSFMDQLRFGRIVGTETIVHTAKQRFHNCTKTLPTYETLRLTIDIDSPRSLAISTDVVCLKFS